ncbi:DNA-binding transcriptional regulator, HxlR family [Catalinimonas alkaloidigena]|uniref:DNA-binding transcriptional regulator, HxlR family n=1 Tax=Catalinimonas alkaloidigena TaxID=1075417 RepID=A0A1G8ZTT9_9BACT|nr:helix-turn-helix domain-containing protein [Catalinimonas alkaloidigena]SDK18536.1 DNA-binding transcriptional regulator, HxlR family [Catalinimonas alkaloidigena]
MEAKVEKYQNNGNCPVRQVLDRLGDKWSMLVLLILSEQGTLRFKAIQRSIGDISQKMLTVTLRTLEADGLVSRRQYAEIPPRVEYELTDLGQSLLPHINRLAAWAVQHMEEITQHRAAYPGR